MLAKQRYKTKAAHLNYPAGTECFVWRTAEQPSILHMQFDDGTEIELPGAWYAEGLEVVYSSHPNCFDIMSERIRQDIDKEVFAGLENKK